MDNRKLRVALGLTGILFELIGFSILGGWHIFFNINNPVVAIAFLGVGVVLFLIGTMRRAR